MSRRSHSIRIPRRVRAEVSWGGCDSDWHWMDLVVGTREAGGQGKVVALGTQRCPQARWPHTRGAPQSGGVAGEIWQIEYGTIFNTAPCRSMNGFTSFPSLRSRWPVGVTEQRGVDRLRRVAGVHGCEGSRPSAGGVWHFLYQVLRRARSPRLNGNEGPSDLRNALTLMLCSSELMSFKSSYMFSTREERSPRLISDWLNWKAYDFCYSFISNNGTRCHPCPRDHGKNPTPKGPCLEPRRPRAGGPRPEGGSRQGPEGVGIIFLEPKGMGWHFVIINWQAGLLFYSKCYGYRIR